jgi:hypothetical protein
MSDEATTRCHFAHPAKVIQPPMVLQPKTTRGSFQL